MRVLCFVRVVVIIAAVAYFMASRPAAAVFATFTVNSLLDTADAVPGNGMCDTGAGICTLRAAIQEANALAGTDNINFSVSGIITIGSVLPAITQQVNITGTTSGVLNQPTVVVNANDLATGFNFSSTATSTSSNSTISGLSIRNADGTPASAGILIQPGAGGLAVSGVVITGCWLGLDDAGTGSGAANRHSIAISIDNSTNNRIGGTTVAERNVIVGSVIAGVQTNNAGNGNSIIGNFIGLRPDGNATISNQAGILLQNSASNIIGGATAASRNIISGNGTGVLIVNGIAPANQVLGNFIGIDDDGSTDRGNTNEGIQVSNSASTLIGPGNVISGNGGTGLALITGTNLTSVRGNIIGLNAAGTASVNNDVGGITIGGAAVVNASTNNTIGGTTAVDRNIISGHTGGDNGILIQNGSNGNQVYGNYIGTDITGTIAIPNAIGVEISNATGNIIGSVGAGRNILSGNNQDGISLNNIAAPGNNQIVGNYVGLQPDGTTALGNGNDGIFIGNPAVTSTIVGPGNVISSNTGDGIQLDIGASNGQIIGNIIGLDAGGTLNRGNGQSGIQVGAAGGTVNAVNNTIGGTTASDRNIISGNGTNGIQIQQNSAGNQILGNYIGTNAAGDAAIPNSPNGILFASDSGTGNNIGSSTAGSGNVISGNQQDGIQFTGANDVSMVIKRNLIGLAASATNSATSGIPNGQRGIQIAGAVTNLAIGRSEGQASPSNDGNLIAFNGLAGVGVSATGPARVQISENSIFSNGGLAIDLAPTGVNANDVDTAALIGPNGRQNFPVITSAVSGSITIMGTLNSVASTSFVIEFFSDTACDASGNGEARVFLGSTTVTTDALGNASFNVTFPGTVPVNQIVTATATRSVATEMDVTSEVSQCHIVQLSTAVEFAGFAAHSFKQGVELEWNTGMEVSNLGFNIYRDLAGVRERLNSSLVAGSALIVGAEAKMLAGNSYRWWDSRPQAAGSTYWVESIDLDGTSEWHGPYGVQSGDGRVPRVGPLTQALMIGEINQLIDQADGSHTVEPFAVLPPLDSPLRTIQQEIAASSAVKIGVERAGWYRLTQPQLLAAGLSPGINPRMLKLMVDGEQVPINVTGELDGKLDPGDTIEFYGLPLDAPSTALRVYWLVEGRELGKRIPKVALNGGAAGPSSFSCTVERDERGVYFSNLLNGDAENFFGAVVRNTPTDQSLTLNGVDPSSPGQDELDVALQGVTVQPHLVNVSINGTNVATIDFFGKALGSAKVQIAHSLLKEGQNIVTLQGEIGASDLSLVDHVRLTYFHRYVADSNRIFFSAPGGTTVRISGFTSSDVRVFDVGDPKSVTEYAATVSGTNGAFEAQFVTSGGGAKKLLAVSSANAQSPALVKANIASQLGSFAGRANFFVLTHASLSDAIRPLVDQRKRDGWKIVTADVEDVYDEYSFGHKTPEAVREWLRAMEKKSRGMNYLLVTGDGSYDPRNYLGFGKFDLVPTKMIDTAAAETASDEWLADFDGDGVAEMAIGRLPARTPEQASAMVAKILSWDRGASGQGATLISDFNDTFNFLGTSNKVKDAIPATTAVDMIISGQTPDVRARLLESINKGPRLVNYAGHGSVDLWRGNILTSADAVGLTSAGKASIFLIMTCLNGYYQSPSLDCLAEALLKAPGGAVAVWASSGFTVPIDQEELDAVMVNALYDRKGITLGRAVYLAKSAIGDPDVRRTWVLFGDPTMIYNK